MPHLRWLNAILSIKNSYVFHFSSKTFRVCGIMFIFAVTWGRNPESPDALAITINSLRKLYEKELSFFQNKKKMQILEKTSLFFYFYLLSLQHIFKFPLTLYHKCRIYMSDVARFKLFRCIFSVKILKNF